MPPELRRAHQADDRAVMAAHGFDVKTTTESSCVAALIRLYRNLTQSIWLQHIKTAVPLSAHCRAGVKEDGGFFFLSLYLNLSAAPLNAVRLRGESRAADAVTKAINNKATGASGSGQGY